MTQLDEIEHHLDKACLAAMEISGDSGIAVRMAAILVATICTAADLNDLLKDQLKADDAAQPKGVDA